MKTLIRGLGVALLAVASLNASLGLCFCHRGTPVPGSPPASHGCCHGQDASGPVAVSAAESCCHVESAERQATPADAVQIAPPSAPVAFVDEPAGVRVATSVATTLSSSSPPLQILRI